MIPDYKNGALIISNIVHFSAREAIDWCSKGAILLDIREEYETCARQFSVANCEFMPNSELKTHYKELPADQLLIIADSVGLRSKEAVIFLQKEGFEHTANLAGGIVDWEREGFPVITNPAEMLHGQCACRLRTNSGKKINYK
ncbi:MAG TPA: hypothetical protein DCQ31_15775 [Bacteroidales bacterium]|nr:hypothetical protein [Bacteroidales bacterium]